MFNFNGVHANTHGLKVVEVDRSPMPAVVNTLLETPSRNGAYFVRNRIKQREIDVKVIVVGSTENDLRTKVRNIGEWLYVDQPQVLTFDDETDRQYLAIVDSASLTEVLKVGEGTLKFICPNPFAEAKVQSTKALTSNANTTVTVGGTAETYGTLTVTFTGATTNFRVRHNGTGARVQVTSPFKAGDVLVIDFSRGYVTINGSNAMPTVSLDSDFFALAKGSNVLNCTTFAGTATLTYKNRWL